MLEEWETHDEMFKTLTAMELRQYFKQFPLELERRDACDETPLIAACAHGSVEVVALLVALGAHVGAVTSAGDTPFRSAIENNKCEVSVAICTLLLDAGADIELRGMSEETPLHSAVSSGKIELARFLLDRGADVNAAREDNETPLMAEMWAARPNTDMIRLLIERGTNLSRKDSVFGKTALEMAEHLDKAEAAQILQRAIRRRLEA